MLHWKGLLFIARARLYRPRPRARPRGRGELNKLLRPAARGRLAVPCCVLAAIAGQLGRTMPWRPRPNLNTGLKDITDFPGYLRVAGRGRRCDLDPPSPNHGRDCSSKLNIQT